MPAVVPDKVLRDAPNELQRPSDVALKLCIIQLLGRGVWILTVVLTPAVDIQLVKVVNNREKGMCCAGIANGRDDAPQHFLVAKLCRIEIPTIGFQHRPDLLNNVAGAAFPVREKALERVQVRPVARLHCTFNIPLDDRRVLFANTRQSETYGRRARSAPTEDAESLDREKG